MNRFPKETNYYWLAVAGLVVVLVFVARSRTSLHDGRPLPTVSREPNQVAEHWDARLPANRQLSPTSRPVSSEDRQLSERPVFFEERSPASRRLFTRTNAALPPLGHSGDPGLDEILARSAIEVDWDAFREIRERGSGRFQIDTETAGALTANVDGVAEGLGGGYSLSGKLEGYPDSAFMASAHGDALVATLRKGNGTVRDYEVVVNSAGQQEIREVDNSSFPICGVAHDAIAAGHGASAGIASGKTIQGRSLSTGKPASSPVAGELAGDLDVIYVMGVYTALARSTAGGTSAMIANIHHAVENANLYLIASGISAVYRLVHTEEVDFDESTGVSYASAENHLRELYWTGGGPVYPHLDTYARLDEVQPLRETHGADIVSLWTGMDYGGWSYRMYNVSNDFEDLAFNVCGASYTRNVFKLNWLFSHECGHLFGCDHDPNWAAGNDLPFPYSYGNRWTGNKGVQYRSIMSYAPGAITYQFSNPNVVYKGAPTGTATANNALTINNTKATVAGFRASVSTLSCSSVPAVARFQHREESFCSRSSRPMIGRGRNLRRVAGSKSPRAPRRAASRFSLTR